MPEQRQAHQRRARLPGHAGAHHGHDRRPVTGWTAAVTKGADGQSVSKIVWTNSGQVDGDGKFPVEIGTIPDGTKTVDFKALDTCDNGEVTRWIEPGENSEHPAPVLAIKAVKASRHDHDDRRPPTRRATTTTPA